MTKPLDLLVPFLVGSVLVTVVPGPDMRRVPGSGLDPDRFLE